MQKTQPQKVVPLPKIFGVMLLGIFLIACAIVTSDRRAVGRGFDWLGCCLYVSLGLATLIFSVWFLCRWQAETPLPLRRQWWRLTGETAFLLVSAVAAGFGGLTLRNGTAAGVVVGVVSLAGLVYVAWAGLRLWERLCALEKAGY